MPNPTINLRMSINGGALISGGVVVSVSDTCQLSLLSNAGITAIRFEIYSYPEDFVLPSGWTNDSTGAVTGVPDAYYYVGFSPPIFTVDPWGKYLVRALGNENTTGSKVLGLTDDKSGLSAISPVNGLEDLAFLEDNRFNPEAYAGAMKANLRIMEAAFGGVGGGKIHYQIFLTNGTWTAPAGVIQTLLYGIGSGGSGGGGAGAKNSTSPSQASGSGGGGGAAVASWVPYEVTPLSTYSVVVGGVATGGAGGTGSSTTPTGGSNGATGANSSFGGQIVWRGARGGGAGFYSSVGSISAGAGGSPSTFIIPAGQYGESYGGNGGTLSLEGLTGQGSTMGLIAGGNGGARPATNAGGGGGGASNWRALISRLNDGGDGGPDTTSPTNAGLPGGNAGSFNFGCGGGGGGGGGIDPATGAGGNGGLGGNGAPGCVIVMWVA